MSRLKLPSRKISIIILAAVVAAGAGAYVTGMLPGQGKSHDTATHVIEPIELSKPFTVNLSDTDDSRYLVLGIAVQLKPMDTPHYLGFSGAGGGGHGPAEAPGPPKVAAYPKFHDAVITTASKYSSEQLLTDKGKKELKAELLERFNEIAEVDAAEHDAAHKDPAHIGVAPPYHVMQVEFTQFAIQ